jgi:hypothetical protein
VCLHEKVGKGGPAGLAVEFLRDVSILGAEWGERGGGKPTTYAACLVPGGKARRPQACCTSFGYLSLEGRRYFLACVIDSRSFDWSCVRTSSMYC